MIRIQFIHTGKETTSFTLASLAREHGWLLQNLGLQCMRTLWMKHLLTGRPPMITTSQRSGREPSLMLKVRVWKSENCSTSRPYPVYTYKQVSKCTIIRCRAHFQTSVTCIAQHSYAFIIIIFMPRLLYWVLEAELLVLLLWTVCHPSSFKSWEN